MSRRVTRRQFVTTGAAAGLAAAAPARLFAQGPAVRTGGIKPVVVASSNGNRYTNGGSVTGVQLAFDSGEVPVEHQAPLKKLMDAAAYEKQCAAEG